MYTIEKLDLSKIEHSSFMYELMLHCKEQFIDDHTPDPVMLVSHYARAIKNKDVIAFLCKVSNLNAGIISVELEYSGIGQIHFGLLSEFRKGTTALWFLRRFVDHCFNTLRVRKLEACIDLKSKAAEKLYRRIGFKKEGIKRAAIVKNKKTIDCLLLGLLKGEKNGEKISKTKPDKGAASASK